VAAAATIGLVVKRADIHVLFFSFPFQSFLVNGQWFQSVFLAKVLRPADNRVVFLRLIPTSNVMVIINSSPAQLVSISVSAVPKSYPIDPILVTQGYSEGLRVDVVITLGYGY